MDRDAIVLVVELVLCVADDGGLAKGAGLQSHGLGCDEARLLNHRSDDHARVRLMLKDGWLLLEDGDWLTLELINVDHGLLHVHLQRLFSAIKRVDLVGAGVRFTASLANLGLLGVESALRLLDLLLQAVEALLLLLLLGEEADSACALLFLNDWQIVEEAVEGRHDRLLEQARLGLRPGLDVVLGEDAVVRVHGADEHERPAG